MATVAEYNTLMDDARNAMGSGDWSTARSKLLQAKVALATLPDGGASSGTVSWRSGDIDALLGQVDEEIKGDQTSGGLSMSKVTFPRLGAGGVSC